METKNIDFEISFFEKLVNEKKDFVDALIPLAEAYTRKGLYEKGLKVDRQLVKLLIDDPTAHYNLACSFSLLGKKTEALKALKQAVRLGYDDAEHMRRDKDLKGLREEPEFKKLLKKIEQNFPAME